MTMTDDFHAGYLFGLYRSVDDGSCCVLSRENANSQWAELLAPSLLHFAREDSTAVAPNAEEHSEDDKQAIETNPDSAPLLVSPTGTSRAAISAGWGVAVSE